MHRKYSTRKQVSVILQEHMHTDVTAKYCHVFAR
jgi:hypothetical protein